MSQQKRPILKQTLKELLSSFLHANTCYRFNYENNYSIRMTLHLEALSLFYAKGPYKEFLRINFASAGLYANGEAVDCPMQRANYFANLSSYLQELELDAQLITCDPKLDKNSKAPLLATLSRYFDYLSGIQDDYLFSTDTYKAKAVDTHFQWDSSSQLAQQVTCL